VAQRRAHAGHEPPCRARHPLQAGEADRRPSPSPSVADASGPTISVAASSARTVLWRAASSRPRASISQLSADLHKVSFFFFYLIACFSAKCQVQDLGRNPRSRRS
jgi:hypothetical protein